MAAGKKSFTYHPTQLRFHRHQKICRGIIHITHLKNLWGVQLLELTFNKPRLKGLITRLLPEEHHSQVHCKQAVLGPQTQSLHLRQYQLYLKSTIPPKNHPTPPDLQRPVKHTATLAPVLLVWIKQNTSLLSIPLRVPSMRHRPAIDTRHLRQPRATQHTHRSAWQISALQIRM